MNPELKPYPTYKDSGVEWLGEVPEHWEVLAFKRLAWFKGGSGFPVDRQGGRDLEIPFYKVSDMNLRGNSTFMTTANNAITRDTAMSLGAMVFPSGTILFPKVGGAMLTNKRRAATQPCCIDNNLMGCIVMRGSPSFQLWLLRYLDFASIAKPGPVPAISEGEVRETKVVFPSFPEQAAIVRYLDYMDRRIQRYIRAKQKLIKLLEEQKQAIIHQAVTGRIDVRTGKPYPAYKPSGVEWLGDVPEHWEVLPLCRKWTVTDCKHLTVPFVDVGIPLISVREVQSFDVRLGEAKHTTEEWFQVLVGGNRQPHRGDLVYCRNVSVGAAAVLETTDTCAMGQDVCLIRSEAQSQRFLNYFMRSPVMAQQLALLKVGSTFDRINVSEVKSLIVVVPPPDEQRSIVRSLDRSLMGTERSIGVIRSELALLREYRTCLISDVVTGKLDVREAAANLPEDLEEELPEDQEQEEEADEDIVDEEHIEDEE